MMCHCILLLTSPQFVNQRLPGRDARTRGRAVMRNMAIDAQNFHIRFRESLAAKFQGFRVVEFEPAG